MDTYASSANYYYVADGKYKENVKVALDTLYLANGSSLYKMDVDCRLNHVSINGLCSGGQNEYCEPGEFIEVNASTSGVCPNPSYVQVDANSTEADYRCWFAHQDANVTGLNISCTNSTCTERSQIPATSPPACYGKTYNAPAGGLYDHDDINPSHWISGTAPLPNHPYSAKTRYRQADAPCHITALDGDRCSFEFNQPQWAVTPGQSVVLYDDEVCLGGAIIEQGLD